MKKWWDNLAKPASLTKLDVTMLYLSFAMIWLILAFR